MQMKQGKNALVTSIENFVFKKVLTDNDMTTQIKALEEAYNMTLAKYYYDYIPKVYSVDNDVIKMEKINGSDLGDYLLLYPEKKILSQIIKKLSTALFTLLKSGIYHRDITYLNIIIYHDNVYLIDFGFCTIFEPTKQNININYTETIRLFMDTLNEFLMSNNLSFLQVKTFNKCSKTAESESLVYLALGSHPNFLTYYGFDNNCLMLEYLDKYFTFEQMFGLNPEYFPTLLEQSYEALDYLHSRGYFHGDLGSPVNILWDLQNNRVVLIDFDSSDLITNAKEITNDNRDLSLLLWIVLDGDVSQEIYDDIVDDNYDSFLIHINNRRKYYDDQRVIDAIIDRLK